MCYTASCHTSFYAYTGFRAASRLARITRLSNRTERASRCFMQKIKRDWMRSVGVRTALPRNSYTRSPLAPFTYPYNGKRALATLARSVVAWLSSRA